MVVNGGAAVGKVVTGVLEALVHFLCKWVDKWLAEGNRASSQKVCPEEEKGEGSCDIFFVTVYRKTDDLWNPGMFAPCVKRVSLVAQSGDKNLAPFFYA